jgi:hypothetical protein
MKNTLYLVQNPVFLTCKWAPAGNPKMPLTCVWTGSKPAQAPSTASSPDESGRIHLCA